MRPSAMLMPMLILLGLAVVVVPVDSGNDEELDPFDMVKFDHEQMKMKKV